MTELQPRVHAAAAAFVERHQPGLWRWLRALGCEPNRAEEHCQDALLAALHHGLDRQPATAAAAWLRTAGKHLFWMQLRREQRRPRELDLEVAAAVETDWLRLRADDDGGTAALRALARCSEQLPARERDLIAARYREHAPRAAMAARHGLSEAGVKMALRRARRRLRACIERRLREASR